MVFFNNVVAVIRGFITRFISVFSQKMKIKKGFIRYRYVEFVTKNNGRILIGENVRIDANSVLSAVNGGELVLGDNVGVGRGNIIKCQKKIIIGEGTLLAPNVLFYDQDHVFDSINGVKRKTFTTDEIKIGKNCWVGANVVILKGTQIGDNCVIGAGSVIKGHYPAGSVIVQKRTTSVMSLERN